MIAPSLKQRRCRAPRTPRDAPRQNGVGEKRSEARVVSTRADVLRVDWLWLEPEGIQQSGAASAPAGSCRMGNAGRGSDALVDDSLGMAASQPGKGCLGKEKRI